MSLALEDLRRVEWELEGGVTRSELVPAGETELLVEGLLALHTGARTNPHSGRPAARLLHLAVGSPRLEAGPWWAGPSLDEAAQQGARLVRWSMVTRFDERPGDDPPDPA